jgi:hypothetical protein
MGCDGMRRDARTCAVRWGWGGFYAGRRQACIRCVYLNEQGRTGQGRSGASRFSLARHVWRDAGI